MAILTVQNTTPKAILRFCCERGVDVQNLLLTSRLDEACLLPPNTRAPVEKVLALWSEASRVTRCRDMSIRVAKAIPFGAFRVLEYVFVNSENLEIALRNTADHLPLINEAYELSTEASRDEFILEPINVGDPGLPNDYIEYILAVLMIRAQMSIQQWFAAKEVMFTSPWPTNPRLYNQVFGCEVKFGQAVNRVVLDRSVTLEKQPNSDPVLYEILRDYADRILNRQAHANPFLEQVRSAIQSGFESEDVTLSSISRRLAMSRRSLQRRLMEHGTSFRIVLDDLRKSRMLKLLETPIDVDVATSSLCYSDVRSFYRAFKRWTGRTPQEFKAANAASAFRIIV